MQTKPEILYIDAQVRGLPTTQRILAALPDVHTELITDLDSMQLPEDFLRAKQQWLMTQSTKRWYHTMQHDGGTTTIEADFVMNAPYDCSYSPLPVIIARRPFLTIHVNIEEALADLGRRCAAQPGQQFRLRCGCLGDPLAMEPSLHLAELLIPFFAWTPNASLEFKTRAVTPTELKKIPHHGRTTILMTVTTERIIADEERGSPSLADRCTALTQLAELGYPIGIVIDPIVQYPDWAADYRCLLETVAQSLPVKLLSRIELSCFHYPRGLPVKVASRFPASRIFFGELVPVNGCFRYLRQVRTQIYQQLVGEIRRCMPQVPITIVDEHGIDTADLLQGVPPVTRTYC
ncbi:MAG: hypothetical protein HYV02_07380 [Deltaproteobacteria bacterium]|nr:hypothetical protein [Deltaproteobacteria bacterium]